MYTFFQLWQKGEAVSYDYAQPVFPKKSNVAINLTSHHTITAALKLSPHVDTMIANDLPVRKSDDPGEREFLFRNVMYFNLKAARRNGHAEGRYCPTVSLLYAVQAYSPDQLMVVMHEIRDFKLDGFSLPIRPYRWNQLLAMLVMLHHLKVKRAHVLGSANVSTLAIVAFAAQHLFDEVSWDASSFHKYSVFLFYQLKDVSAVSISRRRLLPGNGLTTGVTVPPAGKAINRNKKYF